jgi:hypothetical protein
MAPGAAAPRLVACGLAASTCSSPPGRGQALIPGAIDPVAAVELGGLLVHFLGEEGSVR